MSNDAAAGALASLPSSVVVQRPDEAPSYSMSPTQRMRFLFTGSVGQPEFYEERSARGDSPPLHRHPWASWELVLDGRLRVAVDGETFEVGEGDFFYTPPSAAHTFVVVSDESRVVGFNHPGGRFEELNRTVAPLFLEPGGPDMNEVVARAATCDVEILGPPMSL